jgi:hypothetical protein
MTTEFVLLFRVFYWKTLSIEITLERYFSLCPVAKWNLSQREMWPRTTRPDSLRNLWPDNQSILMFVTLKSLRFLKQLLFPSNYKIIMLRESTVAWFMTSEIFLFLQNKICFPSKQSSFPQPRFHDSKWV